VGTPLISRQRFEPSGAVCVVTGASSGLGRRFCIDLAARGATVIGLARRASLLESLAGELRRVSARSDAITCDVADADHFVSLLEETEKKHGRVDVLVNCAGIGEPPGTRPSSCASTARGAVREAMGAYRKVMDTNFLAAVAGTLAVVPGMLERRSGVVVNVSSDSGRAPGPGEPAYCASKAAMSAFTESLALALEGTGVHLHVLYPGWVPTAMGNAALEAGAAKPPRFVRRTEEQVSRLVLARMGSARMDIDAAPVARLAPAAKSLLPAAYKRGVLAASGEPSSWEPSSKEAVERS